MARSMQLNIKYLHPDAKTPTYATDGAAGADIYAVVDNDDGSVTLHPHSSEIIGTGLAFEIPKGYEIQVRPRSGLAFKHGITVANSPGTIDCDYRGELMVKLVSHESHYVDIKNGDRIAQIVLAPVLQAEFNVIEQLSDTARGSGGFGSTGSK